jgi:choline transport protein
MVLNNPDYVPLGWQGTLLYWAVLLLCVFINTALSKALPAIEIAILILHVLGFFIILIPLVYLAPKGDAKDIFTNFQNLGGWQTQALSFFIGLNGNAVAFLGTDGAIHVRVISDFQTPVLITTDVRGSTER